MGSARTKFAMAIPLLGALCLAKAAAAEPGASPVGHYRVTGVHELASELELTADGRFEWALIYGALDEHAAGKWKRDGNRILITTDQPVVPVIFTATSAVKDAAAVLRIKVSGPGGDGLAGVDIVIEFDTGEPATGYTQSYGYSFTLTPGRRVTAIRLGLPAYGVDFTRFAVDPGKANDLGFRFTPNDFGTRDFRAEPLAIQPDGALLLSLGSSALRYERQ